MDLALTLTLGVLNFVADTFIRGGVQMRIIDIFIRTMYLQLTIGAIQLFFD